MNLYSVSLYKDRLELITDGARYDELNQGIALSSDCIFIIAEDDEQALALASVSDRRDCGNVAWSFECNSNGGECNQTIVAVRQMNVQNVHNLKTVQPWFELLWQGSKDWECRENDRDFLAGDRLYLLEWDGAQYLDRLVEADIVCVHHDVPGVIKGYVILTLTNMSSWKRDAEL